MLLPLVQRWAVHLPPALSLIGIVAFGVLFGWIGVLLAAPLMVATTVRKLYLESISRAGPEKVARQPCFLAALRQTSAPKQFSPD